MGKTTQRVAAGSGARRAKVRENRERRTATVIKLHLGDAFKLTAKWAESARAAEGARLLTAGKSSNRLERFDVLMTDFPYSDKTHDGARTKDAETKLVKFDSITEAELRGYLEMVAPLIRTWAIFTADRAHVSAFEASPPAGWKFMQYGVWDKPGHAPQFNGQKPAAGWEAICILHRDVPGRTKWNGGGHNAVWRVPVERGEHETQKPLVLLQAWLRDFTNKHDSVFDPFAGSATTLIAARAMQRSAVGIEIKKDKFEKALARMERERNAQHTLL